MPEAGGRTLVAHWRGGHSRYTWMLPSPSCRRRKRQGRMVRVGRDRQRRSARRLGQDSRVGIVFVIVIVIVIVIVAMSAEVACGAGWV
jgi:hypothetical protein